MREMLDRGEQRFALFAVKQAEMRLVGKGTQGECANIAKSYAVDYREMLLIPIVDLGLVTEAALGEEKETC